MPATGDLLAGSGPAFTGGATTLLLVVAADHLRMASLRVVKGNADETYLRNLDVSCAWKKSSEGVICVTADVV